jgi:hypothetical protein
MCQGVKGREAEKNNNCLVFFCFLFFNGFHLLMLEKALEIALKMPFLPNVKHVKLR